jgi:molecular chaperone DnaK (HSP70)
MVKDNHFIDEFILRDIEPAPKGQPRIAVSFEIDENGILSISATDRKSKEKMFLKINSDAKRFSGEQLEEAKWRANEIELEREKRHKATKAKNDLEKYLRGWKKRLTSGDVTLSAEDREAALQIVNLGLEWFDNHPHESVEEYEKMKATCMEGLMPLLGNDEL